MATKILRVFQEFTSEGYVPMPTAGNIDYGVTIAGTFPSTTPATFQTDITDIEVEVTTVTDFYVWIRSHGTEWNYQYTRNVRVYPDSPDINNVVMGIIIANLAYTVPYTGATENVDLGEFGIKAGHVGFDLTPTGTPTDVGTMVWNDQDGTLDLKLKGGNVTLQIGQEQLTRVVNKTGVNLLEANYQAVKISGAQGNRLKVSLAQANNDANSAETLGLITETILNNEEGFITTSGLVRGINTTGSLQGETWEDGDMLYLSGTTAGKLTNIKPQAPTHTVIMGYVVRSHATQGQIYVKVDNGYELDELHNVKITSVADNDFLIYDATNSVWENRAVLKTNGYLPYFDSTDIFKQSPIFTDGTNVTINSLDVITGGGTANYIPKLGTINTLVNSLLYDNGTNVGIGSTNPQFKFEVRGGAIGVYSSSSYYGKMEISNNDYMFTSGSGFYFNVNNATSNVFAGHINNSGNWGIGILNPTQKLEVNGNINIPTGFNYLINGVQLNTDNIPEGSTNKYLTEAGLYPYMYNFQSGEIRWNVVTHQFYMNQASSTANGWLSNTDWNTFNNKQNALINPVTGSGTTNYIPKFTGTTTIGNSQVVDDGTSVLIGLTSRRASFNQGVTVKFQIEGLSFDTSAGSIVRNSNDIGAPKFVLGKTRGTAVLSNTAVTSGDFLGNIEFQGGDGTTLVVGSSIRSIVDGTVSTSNMPGALAFYTNGVGNTVTERMRIASNGNTGIGSTSLGSISLRVSKSITGGTIAYGILSDGQIQSDVTSQVYYYLSNATTQATTFTLSGLYHFRAIQGTIGAGSSITSQYGIFVGSDLVGATNNFAYYGGIPYATNNWNLYMAGTAPNYMAGSLGIGSTSLTTSNLRISKNITGGIQTFTLNVDGQIQTDVTTEANLIRTQSNLITGGTLTNLIHYATNQGTISGTVTSQVAFSVGNLTSGTTIIGFNGNLSAGTGKWNLYLNGTANNYMAGSLGIGSTTLTGRRLNIAGNITGSTTSYGLLTNPTVQSDVTDVRYYQSSLNTQAATFTLTTAYHYVVLQNSIGVGSAVTNQYGFFVDASVIGATNNYGFYGNIPSATNRWNLYMAGTANNYMAGSLGIGSTALTGYNLRISKAITGSPVPSAILVEGAVQSDATTQASYFYTNGSVAAIAFTLPQFFHYRAGLGTAISTATVTNQYGFYVENTTVGATNNYAFYGNIPAATGRWNLYMNGTANNYIAGNLWIGLTSSTYKVDVSGTVNATALRITGGTSVQYLMADGTTSTLTDAIVTGKVLTGLSISGTSVQASDTILVAIGKLQNQLNGLSGSLSYRGTWNASTNNPSITSGVGTNGYFYIVSVAGTTTIDGISSWAVGDWIIFNGTVWQKVANSAVTSVNGKTGVVTLTTTDISEGTNLYFTNARSISSTLTGYVSGAGTISSSDTILQAIQKLNGNISSLVTGVSSVNGLNGTVTLTTSNINEGTNLYFTNARAISAIFTGTSAQFLKANGTTNEIVTDLDANITGSRNGSNTIFTISSNFVSNSTRVFLNGVRMQMGVGNDYIEVGTNQIQFTSAPDAGDIIVVDYIK